MPWSTRSLLLMGRSLSAAAHAASAALSASTSLQPLSRSLNHLSLLLVGAQRSAFSVAVMRKVLAET